MGNSRTPPATVPAGSISLEAVLRGPDGKDCMDVGRDAEGKPTEVALTLGAWCYFVLRTPKAGDDKMSITETLKLGVLAQRVAAGGLIDLTVDDRKRLIDRMQGYGVVPIFAAVQLLDPAQLEQMRG